MSGINKAIIVGNLGKDPDVRHMPSGGAVATLSIATSRGWRDKQTGEMKEQTEWHRVVLFNRLGEIAGQYLKKGFQVYIEGRIQSKKWKDKSGQERWSTQIIGNEMQMLGGRAGNQNQNGGGQQASAPSNNQPPAPLADDFDDDIPF